MKHELTIDEMRINLARGGDILHCNLDLKLYYVQVPKSGRYEWSSFL